MSYVLAQASAHAIPLPDASVQCVVTSPPYWGLREYAGKQGFVWGGDPDHEHEWGAMQRGRRADLLPADVTSSTGRIGTTERQDQAGLSGGYFCSCGAWQGALGLEPTPELYVEHMVEVFREVGRVLRPDGTLWLNLGDSYWNGGGEKHDGGHGFVDGGKPKLEAAKGTRLQGKSTTDLGLKPKDLIGIPWRVAFALQADGWYLRSDIIWSKPNPMPESVTDRPTKAHEYIFLMSKSPRYYFDADAVREPHDPNSPFWRSHPQGQQDISRTERLDGSNEAAPNTWLKNLAPGAGRNIRTVWQIATQPYAGAHFATFPEAIPERCIKAGSAPGDVVLDPFNGSGTTGRVAQRLGRDYVGLDTSREYLDLAVERVDHIAAARREARSGSTSQQVLGL